MSTFEKDAPTGMLLQQDPDLALAFSYCTMGNSWIVCFHGYQRGRTTLPSRSPDLTQLSYFFEVI
jgi:hypothetical protein